MHRTRLHARSSVIAALILIAGCSPAPSSSSGDHDRPTRAAAQQAIQNTPAAEWHPTLPPAPDLTTLEGRAEAALIEQLRCNNHPQAAKAINTMMRNKLIKKLDEGADGSPIFAPTRPLSLMGFPIVHISGWQMTKEFDPVPPFWRAPGSLPPIFLSVTVKANRQQVHAATRGLGMRDADRLPGVRIDEEDLWGWHTRMKGVTTLTCATAPMDFPGF